MDSVLQIGCGRVSTILINLTFLRPIQKLGSKHLLRIISRVDLELLTWFHSIQRRCLSVLLSNLRPLHHRAAQSTNSAPKTPYNLRQLEKQASTVKTLLKRHTGSPISLLEMRLDKMIKGHEMALNEGILARQEIRELRASHEKQLQKRKRSRRQITAEEGLSIQEGQALVQGRSQEEEVMPTTSTEPAPMAEYCSVRTPPR